LGRVKKFTIDRIMISSLTENIWQSLRIRILIAHVLLNRIVAKSATRRNNLGYAKPNEDYLIVDNKNKIYIICDGVTRNLIDGRYPEPSPSYLAARIFAESVYRKLLLNSYSSNPFQILIDAVIWGNCRIAQLNSERINARQKILPGTVGTVAQIIEDKIYYVYLGDCTIWRFRYNKVERFTTSQTEKIKQQHFGLTLSNIRESLYNNPNHPLGYGVFTGEEESLYFLGKGITDLHKGDVLMLITDGMDLIFQSDNLIRLRDHEPNSLIDYAEKLELNRCGTSDDKSITILKII
jgi:serine/threonine protein phosphatase PrpC